MKLRAAIFAIVMSIASSAPAATFLITYTGTISSGYDTTGKFGPPATDLTGVPYRAVYTLTDPKPGATSVRFGPDEFGTEESSTFGYGKANPLTGVLTINGVSHSFDFEGSAYQFHAIQPGSFVYLASVSHFTTNFPEEGHVADYLINTIFSPVNSFLSSGDYTHPLNYKIKPGDFVYGFFQVYREGGDFAQGDLAPSSVTISKAVPEPMSWTMMIAGFGLVGAKMRRHMAAAKFPSA
jgi:PEP-CTERM motif.